MSPIGTIKIQKYKRDMMFVLQSTVSDFNKWKFGYLEKGSP